MEAPGTRDVHDRSSRSFGPAVFLEVLAYDRFPFQCFRKVVVSGMLTTFACSPGRKPLTSDLLRDGLSGRVARRCPSLRKRRSVPVVLCLAVTLDCIRSSVKLDRPPTFTFPLSLLLDGFLSPCSPKARLLRWCLLSVNGACTHAEKRRNPFSRCFLRRSFLLLSVLHRTAPQRALVSFIVDPIPPLLRRMFPSPRQARLSSISHLADQGSSSPNPRGSRMERDPRHASTEIARTPTMHSPDAQSGHVQFA